MDDDNNVTRNVMTTIIHLYVTAIGISVVIARSMFEGCDGMIGDALDDGLVQMCM